MPFLLDPFYFFSFSFSLVISSFTASSTGLSSEGLYILYTTCTHRGSQLGVGINTLLMRCSACSATCRLGCTSREAAPT